MSVTLRPGEDADLPAVGALHQRSRVAAYEGIIPAAALTARPAEAFGLWWSERRRWEQDTHRLTVAERDGRLAGFTYVGLSETAGAAELYAIHVAPGLTGTGVGRALMVHALGELALFGEPRAVLWVLEANHPARRFYERGGWQPDGATRREAVNDHPVDQLRYAREL